MQLPRQPRGQQLLQLLSISDWDANPAADRHMTPIGLLRAPALIDTKKARDPGDEPGWVGFELFGQRDQQSLGRKPVQVRGQDPAVLPTCDVAVALARIRSGSGEGTDRQLLSEGRGQWSLLQSSAGRDPVVGDGTLNWISEQRDQLHVGCVLRDAPGHLLGRLATSARTGHAAHVLRRDRPPQRGRISAREGRAGVPLEAAIESRIVGEVRRAFVGRKRELRVTRRSCHKLAVPALCAPMMRKSELRHVPGRVSPPIGGPHTYTLWTQPRKTPRGLVR